MTDIKFADVFQLPTRELKALSFSRSDKESVRQWINQLPTADMAKSTRMLYLAIKEVCELDCSANVRIEIIDVLAPAIHLALNGLQKRYLNQSITLPEGPKKIAILCHTLQNYLASAYVITACQASEKMGSFLIKPTALLSRAIFQALCEYNGMLVRDYQLYRKEADRFWKNCHRLYQMALRFKVQSLPQVVDAQSDQKASVEQAYCYLLLLGSIRANQLRQEDIAKLQTPLWHWASMVKLQALGQQNDANLVVEPNSDLPPVYQKFYQGKLSAHCIALGTTALIEELKNQTSLVELKKLHLSQNLLNHLILAWGAFTDRTFMRLESDSHLLLCVGLSTAHFFLSGERDFNYFIYGRSASVRSGALVAEFKEQRREAEKLDVWDTSVFGTDQRSEAQITMESIDYHIRTGGNSMMTLTGTDKEKYQRFEVKVVNMSPGGYCLQWEHDVPATIRAGEIVGLREDERSRWNMGVIRWVKQDKNKSLQIGIELLSPNAEPYAVQPVDFEGQVQADFLRTILLPEVKATGQESSILVPAMLFKVGQYAVLARDGQQQTIQLKKLISSTGSFSQFSFQESVKLAGDKASGKIEKSVKDNDNFDAVWELL